MIMIRMMRAHINCKRGVNYFRISNSIVGVKGKFIIKLYYGNSIEEKHICRE